MSITAEASSSRHTPLRLSAAPSFEPLAQWLQHRGSSWNPSLRVEYDEAMGWRVVATDHIARGDALCAVPKSQVLSHRTASFSAHLPIDVSSASSTDAILQLAACLLHELRLGRSSSYWGWTQLLPKKTVVLPTFWEDEELGGGDGRRGLKWLAGTAGESELARKCSEHLSLADLESFHEAVRDIFPPTDDHPSPPTLYHFLYAYSMVCSRAFVIDNYHTIGLIPFCDLFNHSNSGHSSLLSDQGVCSSCGSLNRCPHDDEEAERLQDLSEEYLEEVEKEGMSVDMRAEKSIEKGDEVFSCYEPGLGNGKLLVEWGFVSCERGGKGVVWSPRELIEPTAIKRYAALLLGLASVKIPFGSPVATPADTEEFGLLNVNAEGQVSLGLLIAAYIRSEQTDDTDPNTSNTSHAITSLERIIESVSINKLDRDDQSGIDEANRHNQRETASVIVGILQERLSRMYRSDMDLCDLRALLSSLADGHKHTGLRRMAMSLAIEEREMIQNAIHRWQALT